MTTAIYEYEHEEGDVSEQTRYYTDSLRDLVKAFAEVEDLTISIIEARANETMLEDNPVTTFQIMFVTSELSSNEIDQIMKKKVN